MGRNIGAVAQQANVTQMDPIGGISNVFRSGDAYKAVGELVQRSIFTALSAAFPRNGAFSSVVRPQPPHFSTVCACGNGVMVIINNFNTSGYFSGSQISVSYDFGLSFQVTALPAAGAWKALIFAGNQFVLMGDGGACQTSTDGLNWTIRSIGTGNVRSIAYGNGLYVAVGDSGLCKTSPDGINWTVRSMPTADNFSSVTYCAALSTFVAVATSSTANAASSTNGTTWTARTLPSAVPQWTSVTSSANLFVAIGAGFTAGTLVYIATSPDGITWTLRSCAPTSAAMFCSVAFGNGVFVASTGVNNQIITSTDGITWIPRPSSVGQPGCVIYIPLGFFVGLAIGNTPGMSVIYAEDYTISDYLYLNGTAGNFVRVK